MNYNGGILPDIQALLELFAVRCSDKSTLHEIMGLLPDRGRWKHAHSL